MISHIRHFTLFVEDQEKALSFYRDALNFRVIANTLYGENTRWIEVAPNVDNQSVIVLIKADTPEKEQLIGKQAVNHVLFTLMTDNLEQDYQDLKSRGVHFLGEPKDVPWGREVVFEDLYGNKFDLVERKPMPRMAPRMA